MPFVLFVLLFVTFPYWFPIIALPAIAIGLLWVIGYPAVCTAHWLWMRLIHKKTVSWQPIAPGK